MFEFVAALTLAVLAGVLLQTMTSGAIDRAIDGFRELIGGWRPDAWPRGVQEEDRDRRWGAGTVAPIIQGMADTPAHAVATAHVRGYTRRR
jgi:hypothetical protein